VLLLYADDENSYNLRNQLELFSKNNKELTDQKL
jgi:hypothetical protein